MKLLVVGGAAAVLLTLLPTVSWCQVPYSLFDDINGGSFTRGGHAKSRSIALPVHSLSGTQVPPVTFGKAAKNLNRKTPNLGFLSDGILTSEGIQRSLQAIEGALAGDTSSGLVVVAGQGEPLTEGKEEKFSRGNGLQERQINKAKREEQHHGHVGRGGSKVTYEIDYFMLNGGSGERFNREPGGSRRGTQVLLQDGRRGLLRDEEVDFTRRRELIHDGFEGGFSFQKGRGRRGEYRMKQGRREYILQGGFVGLGERHMVKGVRQREGSRLFYEGELGGGLQGEDSRKEKGGNRRREEGRQSDHFLSGLISQPRSSVSDPQTATSGRRNLAEVGVGGLSLFTKAEDAVHLPNFRGRGRIQNRKEERGRFVVIGTEHTQVTPRSSEESELEASTRSMKKLRPFRVANSVKEIGVATGTKGRGGRTRETGRLIVSTGGEEFDVATEEDFQKIIKSILYSDNLTGKVGSLGQSHETSKERTDFTTSLNYTGGTKSSVSINFGDTSRRKHKGASHQDLNQGHPNKRGDFPTTSNVKEGLQGPEKARTALSDVLFGGIQESPTYQASNRDVTDTNFSVSEASSTAAASFLKASLGDLSKYPPGVWRISR